jgi:hypothetical protein
MEEDGMNYPPSHNYPPRPRPGARETKKRYGTFAGFGIAMASVLGAGTLAGGWLKDNIGTEDSVAARAPQAVVTKTYPLPPKACDFGYDTAVTNSTVAYNKKLKIGTYSIPTTISASETFNGTIKNMLCNTTDPGQEVVTFDPNKNTLSVKFQGSSQPFDVVVSQADPTDPNAYTPHNGFLMAQFKNAANNLDALGLAPFVASHLPNGDNITQGPNRLDNFLRGEALMGAYAVSSEACGKSAYAKLLPQMQQHIGDVAFHTFQTFNVDPAEKAKLTREHVTVSMPSPDGVVMHDQYAGRSNNDRQRLAAAGINFSGFDASTLTCNVMNEQNNKQFDLPG